MATAYQSAAGIHGHFKRIAVDFVLVQQYPLGRAETHETRLHCH
jgi:hypothetical protein